MVKKNEGLLVHAHPKATERLYLLLVLIPVSFVLTGVLIVGGKKVLPSYFEEPRPLVVLASICCMIVVGLLWNERVNNLRRNYRLFGDRIEIGPLAILFSEIEKIRVGAPLTTFAKGALKVNQPLALLSVDNANAAEFLKNGFANVVVIDTAAKHTLIHVGTVKNGHELLRAFVAKVPEALAKAEYSDEELKRLKSFKKLSYLKA